MFSQNTAETYYNTFLEMHINFRTIKSLLFNLALFHIILTVIGLKIIFALFVGFITAIEKEMITKNTLF